MGNGNILGIIKEIGIIITPIVLAYIAYKQIKLGTATKSLHKDVNGKIQQLIDTKDEVSIEKQKTASLEGEKKGAADNQALTDAKQQSKK